MLHNPDHHPPLVQMPAPLLLPPQALEVLEAPLALQNLEDLVLHHPTMLLVKVPPAQA
jgi:hypothetical protein